MAKHTVEFEVKVSGQGEQGFKKIEKASDKAHKSSAKYQKSIALLNKELTRLTTQRDLATDPKRIKALNKEIANTKKQIEASMGSTNKLGSAFKKLGAVVATAAIGKKILDIGTASVKASANMEKFNVTLQTMLGSKSKANARMNEYMDIAKKTPFQLEEVVSAGNQLQAVGKYSRDNLTMLGDLAAASGKPIDQVIEAYSKLASGQKGIGVEMFRNLLISSKDWQEATGKGIKTNGELLASTDELISALPSIMQKKRFTGLMAAQSRTTEGMISNLEDSMYSLKVAMGDKLEPSVKGVVGWLGKMVNSMEQAVAIPSEEKIAREKVELNMLVEQLINSNDEEEMRNHWISELQMKYPEFLKNIDLEKDGTDGLKKSLMEVNKEYDKRIKKAIYAKRLEELEEQYGEEFSKYTDLKIAQGARSKSGIYHDRLVAAGIPLESLSQNEGKGYYDKNGKFVQSSASVKRDYEQWKLYSELGWGGKYGWLSDKGLNKRLDKYDEAKIDIGNQMTALKELEEADEIMTSAGDISMGRFDRGHSTSRVNVGKIEIHANTLTESAEEMERIITNALQNAAGL